MNRASGLRNPPLRQDILYNSNLCESTAPKDLNLGPIYDVILTFQDFINIFNIMKMKLDAIIKLFKLAAGMRHGESGKKRLRKKAF